MLAFALAPAACSLTDLDGLSSGGPVGDSGTLPPDSGPDAVAKDGSADADGAPDGPFCKSRTGYAFCADFDEGTAPAPFDELSLEGMGNSITYDSADFRSAPRSALFTGGNPSEFSRAGLTWKSKTITTEVVVELDVRVIDLGKRPFDIIGFSNGADDDLELEINELGVLQFDIDRVLPDGGDGGQVIPTTGILDTAWHHVTFRATRSGTDTMNVSVSLDDQVVGTATGTPAKQVLGSPVLSIGDSDLEPTSTPWKLRLDNVLVTVK